MGFIYFQICTLIKILINHYNMMQSSKFLMYKILQIFTYFNILYIFKAIYTSLMHITHIKSHNKLLI